MQHGGTAADCAQAGTDNCRVALFAVLLLSPLAKRSKDRIRRTLRVMGGAPNSVSGHDGALSRRSPSVRSRTWVPLRRPAFAAHLAGIGEQRRAVHELREDAADGPHVQRRPVVLAPQQQLGGAVVLSHDLQKRAERFTVRSLCSVLLWRRLTIMILAILWTAAANARSSSC